jgi:hypothetical protein
MQCVWNGNIGIFIEINIFNKGLCLRSYRFKYISINKRKAIMVGWTEETA